MKNLFLLIVAIFFLNVEGYTQTMTAEYKVSREVEHTKSNGQIVKLATLDFKSFLYKTNNKYYSYSVAEYLGKYPSGTIEYSGDEGNSVSIGFSYDSLQDLSFKDLDSLKVKGLSGNGTMSGVNSNVRRGTYNPSLYKWKILPDTATIFGLKCQKAIMDRSSNGERLYDIWFCIDVPVFAGPASMAFVPGLVVEAYCPVTKDTYTLKSYAFNTPMPESFKKIAFFDDVIQK